VLFVVKGDVGGVQAEEVSDLVRHVGANLFVPAVSEPDLEEALLRPERNGSSNYIWLLELLAYKQTTRKVR